MGVTSRFNRIAVGGACDVGGGEVLGDASWSVPSGRKLRVGEVPDGIGSKYVTRVVGEVGYGNIAVPSLLNGV